MAWITKDGNRVWYDEKTQTYVPKEKLIEYRKVNPRAYIDAGDDAAIAAQVASPEEIAQAQKNASDPNNTNIVNAGAQTYLTPFDSAVPQVVMLSDQFKQLNDTNNEQFKDPTKIEGYNDQQNTIDKINKLNTNDQDAAIKAIMDSIGKGGNQQQAIDLLKNTIGQYDTQASDTSANSLYDAIYGRAASKLNAAAQAEREQNAADLASRGLGMSTVVNDVNSVTNRNLGNNLQTATYDAEVAREKQIMDALAGKTNAAQGIGTIGNNMASSAAAAGQLANNRDAGVVNQQQQVQNAGINKNQLYATVMNQKKALGDQVENNALLNLGLGNANRANQKANFLDLAELPYKTAASGNQASANATQASTDIFNQANANYANKQKDIGSLFSGLFTKALGK